MAILINYFSDYPIGTVMFAINVPMVLLSIRYIVKGFGFDLTREREVLMLVVDNNKVQVVKSIVETHDDEGLLIVMEASELLGRGH